MSRSRRLAVVQLEDRNTPVAFGNPWPDGQHLTLSFAPDGTALTGGVASELNQDLAALGTNAAEMEMLRAFRPGR